MSAVLPASRIDSRPAMARWDLLFIGCALAHGVLVLTWPSIPLIAILLWWNANTVAHNFIHRPFGVSTISNNLFSSFLTLIFGFPQSLWKQRHLAHHAGSGRAIRVSALLVGETALALALWITLIVIAPGFVLTIYFPGWLSGLVLCQLHGYYEHQKGTTSHYGWLYNVIFFNDGYHREHHARPGAYWKELPGHVEPKAIGSRWPAILRWLEVINLCNLERCVLRSRLLQDFVVDRHERAMRRLLARVPAPATVGVVGGGLFPRTAIVLGRVLPETEISLIDLSPENLTIAREFLTHEMTTINERFDPHQTYHYEMLVVPLAFIGDREVIYNRPSAKTVMVHDWIWNCRGESTIVSWLLLKRLNLVAR
jgi:hypothetical protein